MRVDKQPMKPWKSYEEVATYLLNHMANHFGLARVEGKQKISGVRSGTEWEIDAKGVQGGQREGFVIIECRRHTTSKQNQERLGALAYRIVDTGAAGGILVSPLGLQEGAAKIAANEEILEVQLNANCTPDEFVIRFLNKLMIAIKEVVTIGDSACIVLSRNCRKCGRLFEVTDNATVCLECLASE